MNKTVILEASIGVATWILRIKTEFLEGTPNALSDDENLNIFEQDGYPKYTNAILALQNYKAIWANCVSLKWTKKQAHERLMVNYINNIIAYHAFTGEKMIVRSEDIFTDYQQESQRILDFAQLTCDIPEPKLKNFEKVEVVLDPKFRDKIDKLFQKRMGGLYETYLAQYAEPQET